MLLRKAVFKSDKEKDLSSRKDLGDEKQKAASVGGDLHTTDMLSLAAPRTHAGEAWLQQEHNGRSWYQ